MILKDNIGREIEVEISGSDFDDVMIETAVYVDTGEELLDDAINTLQDDNYGTLCIAWNEYMIDEAEHWASLNKDYYNE